MVATRAKEASSGPVTGRRDADPGSRPGGMVTINRLDNRARGNA